MFIPVVLVLVAENVGHVKSVSQMTGRDYDDQIGTALFADGLGTTIAGFGGGSGTTTYGENIGVMAATKVYSTAAYWCAAAFALILSLCPKFGAIINTIPAGVLGGVTTLLYGMIGMVGIRIWVENKVNFDKPVNVMVAAITMIIAVGQFEFAFNGISFNGIASAPSSSSSPTTAEGHRQGDRHHRQGRSGHPVTDRISRWLVQRPSAKKVGGVFHCRFRQSIECCFAYVL